MPGRGPVENRTDYWKYYGGAALLTIIGFVVAYQFVEPAPPNHLRMTAGSTEGAYYGFAQRYGEILAQNGITIEVVESQGSVDNLQRLTDPAQEFDLALVQGGVGDPAKSPELRSLGSLYYEPLWVFYRGSQAIETLGDLRGKRVASGAQGSGTRAVLARLMRQNELGPELVTMTDLSGMDAAAALIAGDVDVAVFVSSPRAAAVAKLLREPDIVLLSFQRAEAYARLHPFLNRVVLPRGVISFAHDLPATDVELLAPAATLVAHESLHPALVDLLLLAAQQTHGNGSIFERPGQFPSPRFVDYPLSEESQRFFKFGPPFLQRYLPFWAANLVDRLKVLMLPLLTVLFPLFKVVPPFYSWRVRRRIYKWYGDVREIEMLYLAEPDEAKRASGLAQLKAIEQELIELKVPLGVTDALYHLRQHLRFVRDELNGTL